MRLSAETRRHLTESVEIIREAVRCGRGCTLKPEHLRAWDRAGVLESLRMSVLSKTLQTSKQLALNISDNVDQSYVYFIADKSGPIKIGVARQPSIRLKNLQTGNPRHLRLIAVLLTSGEYERDIQHCLLHAHIRGEWFHPTSKVRRFINEVKQLNACPSPHSPAWAIRHTTAAAAQCADRDPRSSRSTAPPSPPFAPTRTAR